MNRATNAVGAPGDSSRRRARRERRTIAAALRCATLALALLLSIFSLSSARSIDAEPDAEVNVKNAVTGRPCVDSDPLNCPLWAAEGACETDRNEMRRRCKKSCNRCHVVRVSDPSEINRFLAQKQTELQQKRKQRRQEQEAMKVLKGESGGNRAGPAAAAAADAKAALPGEATMATDAGKKENDESATVGLPHSSSTGTATATATSKPHPKTSTKPTARTTTKPRNNNSSNNNGKKKKAKIDAETGLECVDKDRSGNCPFWASTGECNANRTWMHANCRLSCDRCHVVRVRNEQDISRFLATKTKAKAKDIEKLRRAREARRVLEGGSFGASSGRGEL